ncbi:competence protein CoiA [Saliterribacillus persicus]|uniref:Competence CoiA-like predicted nuclease n=1 Tax=Saliterribacillus persicus TaxID=930114 RepID=A0A368XP59_9BACI|nr:competence protein CoiA family protein [Saliterribacillus persicus]RCW69743.1 competence CoiA-like predicted nuclease [Saliterribacillus persicus]
MLKAIDENEKSFILASFRRKEIEKLKGNQFYCPTCKEKVIIKAGTKMIAHFAHVKQHDCAQQGEGAYHEQGKWQLFSWLKKQDLEVKLEYYLSEISQRPDIYLEIGKKKIVIEYQCARISEIEFLKRNEGYQQENITPIWILGGNWCKRKNTNQLTLSSFERMFIHQYDENFPLTLYFYCSTSKTLILFQDLHFLKQNLSIGNLHIQSLARCKFMQLFEKNYINKNDLANSFLKEKWKFRNQPVPAFQKKEVAFRKWLYSKELHPCNLPEWIGMPVTHQFLININPHQWQSYLLFELIHQRGVTISQLVGKLSSHFLSPLNFPLIKSTKNPIEEYLNILEKLAIVEITGLGEIRLKDGFRKFKSVNEAILADENLANKIKGIRVHEEV